MVPRRMRCVEPDGAAPVVCGVVVGGVDNDFAWSACFDRAVTREPAHALKSKRSEANRVRGRSFENPLAAVCGAKRCSGEGIAAERTAKEMDAGGDGGVGVRRALERCLAGAQREERGVFVLGFDIGRKRETGRRRKRSAFHLDAAGRAIYRDGRRGECAACQGERVAQQRRIVGGVGSEGQREAGLDDKRVGGDPVVGRRHGGDDESERYLRASRERAGTAVAEVVAGDEVVEAGHAVFVLAWNEVAL